MRITAIVLLALALVGYAVFLRSVGYGGGPIAAYEWNPGARR